MAENQTLPAPPPQVPAVKPEDYARIKGNLDKLLEQNAPEADLDSYLKHEGVTLEQLRANKPEQLPPMGHVEGMLDQAGGGIPVVGPLLRKVGAAGAAAIQPLLYDTTGYSFSDRYANNLENSIKRSDQYAKENPIKSAVANVVGTGVALAPAAATSAGAGILGLSGPMLQRMALGGVSGGVLGGADAKLRGHDVLPAATIGGVIGLGSPVVGRALGIGFQKAAEMAAPLAAPLQNYARGAVNRVSRAVNDDAVTPQNMLRHGDDAMLLDLGPNVRGQADALATQPGGSQRIVTDAVTHRHQGAADRITRGVDQTIGPRPNLLQETNLIREQRKAASDPLYEAWRNTTVHPTDELKRIAEIAEGQGLTAKAQRLAELEGVKINRNFFTSGEKKDWPTAQTWDYIKQAIDAEIGVAQRGGDQQLVRAYTGFKAQLDNAIATHPDKTIAGVWQAARNEYASHSRLLNRIEEGQTVFSRTVRPDELRAEIAAMPQPEREAFLRGARDQIDMIMGNASNDALSARNLFAKDWNAEKLEMIVGPQQARRLLGLLDNERAYADAYGSIMRQSATRGRLAAGKEFPNKIEPDLGEGTAGVTMFGAGIAGLKKGWNALSGAGNAAAAERLNTDAARLLTMPMTRANEPIVEALLNRGRYNASIQPRANRVDEIATFLMQSGNEPAREIFTTKDSKTLPPQKRRAIVDRLLQNESR